MPEVVSAVLPQSDSIAPPASPPVPSTQISVVPKASHDVHGRFVKGHHIGRPKGVRNAEKAYLRAAPKLAKAYIKKALNGDSTLLKDSREWIMPTEKDLLSDGNARVMIFIGDGELPRRTNNLPSSDLPPLVAGPDSA